MWRFLKEWVGRNWMEVAIVVGLFVVAAVPRLSDLGVFLTADEKNWIGRSYEFVRAFKDWRFNDMLQTTHPGVTTLWLAGAAVTVQMLVSHIPFSFRNLVHFVTAAQFPIALANALLVPVMYVLLRQLFRGRLVPVVASLVVALDPFVVGYSRVVHVDALLMGLMFTAALALVLYMERGWSRRWLVAAGVLSGLALLTKAPAVFLLPWLGLVILVGEGRRLVRREVLVARLRDVVVWLLVVGLLFVTLWPAILWVPNPEGNVLLLKRDIGRAAITPHHQSQEYRLNSSFYVGTLLARTSPVVLVLSLLAVGGLLLRIFNLQFSIFPVKSLRDHGAGSEFSMRQFSSARVPWLLVAYVFFFVVMMMLGAKKGDRYILPAFPALDVLAAVGVVGLAGVLANFQFSIFNFQKRVVVVVLAGMLVLYLGVTVVRYHPYEIAYSSPLFRDNLSQELGWGEGLEQVGRWLDEGAPEAVVASWYPEELGAYTRAQVAHINAHEQGKVRFVVLYRNMFGRAADHPANDFIDEYYRKREPVFVARVAGKEFAWVYEKPVYERVVGELTPGRVVEQEVVVERGGLVGVEVLVATYSGRAQVGELVVAIREAVSGREIQRWTKPVAQLEDNHWEGFELVEPLGAGRYVVAVAARGTRGGDAPTVRYTRDFDYRDAAMVLDSEDVAGDLGVRLRYEAGTGTALEEHTLLLR